MPVGQVRHDRAVVVEVLDQHHRGVGVAGGVPGAEPGPAQLRVQPGGAQVHPPLQGLQVAGEDLVVQVGRVAAVVTGQPTGKPDQRGHGHRDRDDAPIPLQGTGAVDQLPPHRVAGRVVVAVGQQPVPQPRQFHLTGGQPHRGAGHPAQGGAVQRQPTRFGDQGLEGGVRDPQVRRGKVDELVRGGHVHSKAGENQGEKGKRSQDPRRPQPATGGCRG